MIRSLVRSLPPLVRERRSGALRALALLWMTLAAAGCASTPAPPVQAIYENGAVATDHIVASEAGAEMLRLGGNAVDAAIASSFCLSVVTPYSCGIGGGGFMVVHEPARDGRPARSMALDYRETAPAAMGPSFYVDIDDPVASWSGALSVGVPGTVAGLLYALESWGTLDRATVLAPAIRAAEEGFAVGKAYVEAVGDVAQARAEFPQTVPSSEYVWSVLCHEGRIEVGDIVRQPAQAKALRVIAEGGADAFYRGPIAASLAETMTNHGGVITTSDLANYSPVERAPLVARGVLEGSTVLSMPPPSSGGVAMQQILRVLDHRLGDIPSPAPNDPAYVQLVTEAMKHAFADRSRWLADSDHVDVPLDMLLDEARIADIAASIELDRTAAPAAYGTALPEPDDSGTSHLCAIDQWGMAVACTETINLFFGSLLAVDEWGIVLNDEMDDFTSEPGVANAFGLVQSDNNLPAPGKRPLSSMSPTIVLRDGRVVLIAGAAGGPRIITGTLQVLLNCLLFDMDPVDALAMPRFHHQWMPDRLDFEETWTDDGVIDALALRGHATGRNDGVGKVQVILIDAEGIKPASDARKGGVPAGH